MKNRLRRHRSVAEHPKHDVHSGTRYRRRRYRADTALRSKTADKAERQKGRYQTSQQSLTPIRRIPRISGCRQGSRRQKRSYPLSTQCGSAFGHCLRSSFARYLVYFRPRGRPFYATREPSHSATDDNVRKRRIKVPSDRA